MDIVQMGYFISIVECRCNLSLAAKKIHISQSALSQFITQFEANEGVQLFHRKNGRLDGLTEAGELVFRFATEILAKHEEMEIMIQRESAKQQGTIRMGVPSLILRVYFSNILPDFLLAHPDIDIQISEGGGIELLQKFLIDDLNFALLIEPTKLDSEKYEQHIIQMDEYVAFMDKDHPLAQKIDLEWKDIRPYPIATFNKSFTTYHMIMEKMKKERMKLNLAYLSSSWDYLIEATHGNEIISILPRPVEELIDKDRFTVVRFRDYIPFNIWLCRPYKSKYGEVESFAYEEFLKLYYSPVVD
ncbi:LysR family transcriptional regulator [Streptococcus marmotae]|uniref:LysR family transcriptional regulator n=1 Tax=Streptococcus marmotae TaxID=1825069 RepID=UPI0008313BE6|nr:LysR family transcriptional regulator [Streptococcus marmotae]